MRAQIMPSFARPLISGTPTPSSSISTELSPARRRLNRAELTMEDAHNTDGKYDWLSKSNP